MTRKPAWSTKSASTDLSAIEHVRSGRGRVPYPLYRFTVAGIEVVTTLTPAEVEQLVPAERCRAWAEGIAAQHARPSARVREVAA